MRRDGRGTHRIPQAHRAVCDFRMPLFFVYRGGIMDKTETILTFGGALKDLGDNRFGGYLVRFTSENDPDLVTDYFDNDPLSKWVSSP